MTPQASARSSAGVGVLYEDDDLAVVAKPAGMVVYAAKNRTDTSLIDALRGRMPLAQAGGPDRPGIVHRLDKDTSGLLAVAKTDRALMALTAAMKSRAISRWYLALASGSFHLPRGRIEAPVGRSRKDPTRMSVANQGKPAATNFRVLEEYSTSSYLEVGLETGRTHQIRVHLSHIKHPIVGDSVYGPATLPLARSLGLRRPFLHAVRLRFVHPITGGQLDLSQPLPPDLEAALLLARSG